MAEWELCDSGNTSDTKRSYCLFVVPFSVTRFGPAGPDNGATIDLALSETEDLLITDRVKLTDASDAKWTYTARTEYFVGDIVESLFSHAKRYRPIRGETESPPPFDRPGFLGKPVDLKLDSVQIIEPEAAPLQPPARRADGCQGKQTAVLDMSLGLAIFRMTPLPGCSLADWLYAVEKGRYIKRPHQGFETGKNREAPMGAILNAISGFVVKNDCGDITYFPHWPTKASLKTDPIFRMYPDDRAFVYSFNIIDTPSGVFGTCWEDQHPSLKSLWHQILYVESDPRLSTPLFKYEEDWIKERTYERWRTSTYGTSALYGYSIYSAAALVPASFFQHAHAHWQDMYFDFSMLLLYQRCMCFRASSCLAAIAREWTKKSRRSRDSKSEIRDFKQEFSKLRETFTQFTKLYWFPLLSNQVQGMEMFDLAKRQMDTQVLFDEVEREIQTTHDFISALENDNHTKGIDKLTKFSILFAFLSIFVGALGTNLYVFTLYQQALIDSDADPGSDWVMWLTGALVVVSFVFLALVWCRDPNSSLRRRWTTICKPSNQV